MAATVYSCKIFLLICQFARFYFILIFNIPLSHIVRETGLRSLHSCFLHHFFFSYDLPLSFINSSDFQIHALHVPPNFVLYFQKYIHFLLLTFLMFFVFPLLLSQPIRSSKMGVILYIFKGSFFSLSPFFKLHFPIRSLR